MSWAEVAREVFRLRGRDPADVLPVTAEQNAADRAASPRPASSVLALGKLTATGFTPIDARTALRSYVASMSPLRP